MSDFLHVRGTADAERAGGMENGIGMSTILAQEEEIWGYPEHRCRLGNSPIAGYMLKG